jgi:hypothetical protein
MSVAAGTRKEAPVAVTGPGSWPLPYQPLRIVDISPYRSSIRSGSVGESGIRAHLRRGRRNALVVLPSAPSR